MSIKPTTFWQQEFAKGEQAFAQGGKAVYGASKTVGRVTAIMGAIGGTIIGLIFIGIGIYLIVKTPEMIDTNTGKKIKSKSGDYLMGGIFILSGLVAMIGSIVNAWLTTHSGVYAAAEGGGVMLHKIL